MGSAKRPAHRLRLRAEMGLRQLAAPDAMLRVQGRHSDLLGNVFGCDEPAADHTDGYHGIGDRPSVAAGAAVAVFRGASVRLGDGRADRGRYRRGAGYPRSAEPEKKPEPVATPTPLPDFTPARQAGDASSPQAPSPPPACLSPRQSHRLPHGRRSRPHWRSRPAHSRGGSAATIGGAAGAGL